MYRKHFNTRATPQSDPIPGSAQVPNSAGGHSWQVDHWTQLDRFLILGTEGGTYYVVEKKLSVDNATAVMRCLETDGVRAVNRIVEISESGRAPKNDPALYALAMATAAGDLDTRRLAVNSIPRVARIGTHLFNFMEFVEGFRGWGRALRRGVADWYTGMPVDKLAYQAIKYRQRNGWSHRDALRLAHPKAKQGDRNAVFKWIVSGLEGKLRSTPPDNKALRLIWAYERVSRASTASEAAMIVSEYNLPWEAVPSQFLSDKKVWQALLPWMPLTALTRNLARMTANGTLKPMSDEVGLVLSLLSNQDAITRSRIHPIQMLTALLTYSSGRGLRGSLSWTPVPQIITALDRAFYMAFGNVRPTNKRIVLALDVSGSMSMGGVAGVQGLTPRMASAAMALVTANVENRYIVHGFSTQFVPLNITAGQRLDDAVRAVSGLPFAGTDCALPMTWALDNGVEADAFVVYTDNETWYGRIHPSQALKKYRQVTGIPAKLAVVGMLANRFSIADPNDSGMFDVVGFDTATPNLISDFIGE